VQSNPASAPQSFDTLPHFTWLPTPNTAQHTTVMSEQKPYPSAPVVLIDPLADFLGRASAELLRRATFLAGGGMVAAAGFVLDHLHKWPPKGSPIPDRHCQGFSSARSWIVERLCWLTDSGIGCARGCVLTTRSPSIVCQVRHCSSMA